MLTCSHCDTEVSEKDVVAQWGPSGDWPRSAPAAATRRRSAADQREVQAGLFPQTMSVLGNRWACALLVAAFVGTSRFSRFQELLGAPPGSIADRLRTLRTNGILATAGHRRAYVLTEKGRAFFPVLASALEWGQRWFLAPEGPAVILTHSGCGQRFTAALRCDQCTGTLSGNGVAMV